MPFAAQAAGGSNPRAQIGWMWGYMNSAWGGPIGAAAHERAFNWYGNGLAGGIFDHPTLIGVGDGGPERVNVTPLHRDGGSHADPQIERLIKAVERNTNVTAGLAPDFANALNHGAGLAAHGAR
jgi:hypothetical protein